MRKFDPAEFKAPGPMFRPAPFWSWNDDLEETELRRQIREMAKKGWGGYFMHSRVGLITPYLSEKWHSLIAACADEADRTGTFAWLYDEDKWPSGFAGGLVPEEDEKFRQRALIVRPAGEAPSPTGTVLRNVTHEGVLFEIVSTVDALGDPWYNGTCYVDLMNPGVTDKFLSITVDGYRASAGKSFGRQVPGIFTDEPTYCRQEWGKVNRLPWTERFGEEFKSRRGYDLLERIEQLFFRSGDWRKTRHDFFLTATQLFVENFTERYFKKCSESNLVFTGHFMGEDSLEEQVRWIGAAMPHYEFQHWPGIDKLGRNTAQSLTCKQVSSVADQLGKERTFCEVYGCSGQHFDFSGRRWVHHWEAALGVNFVNHHLSLYTMAGERKRDYPPNFFFQQPWWPYEKSLSDHFARLNYALTRGERDLDILVLHPIASAWAVYDPRERQTDGTNPCSRYDRFLQDLTDGLLSSRLDFHFGDETIMARHAGVRDSTLSIGRHGYRYVVVPQSLTWSANTLRLLREFHDAGGRLIFCGEVPRYADMAEERDFRADFPKAVFHSRIDDLLAALGGEREATIRVMDRDLGIPAGSVFSHVRLLEDGSRLVFLTNTAEKKVVNAAVRLPWSGPVTRIWCESGKSEPYDPSGREEDGGFHHTFHGGGYLLLRTGSGPVAGTVVPAAKTAVLSDERRSRLLFKWNCRPLDPNALVIDRVDLFKSEDRIAVSTPVFRLWDSEFYAWPEGTPFRALYRFRIDSMPAGRLKAVIERASNLDFVFLNDRPLRRTGRDHWLDPRFEAFDITRLAVTGENVLEIGGRKFNNITGPGTHRRVTPGEFPFRPTELEAVYITGGFEVSNGSNSSFAIVRSSTFRPTLADITKNGYPFYAGLFSFTTEFSLAAKPASGILDFSGVRMACIDVRVNGKKAGTLMWEPFLMEVGRLLRKGRNSVELVCPTDLFNLMGPNPEPMGLPAWTGPHDFRDSGSWSERRLLLSKGIDSVRLLTSGD